MFARKQARRPIVLPLEARCHIYLSVVGRKVVGAGWNMPQPTNGVELMAVSASGTRSTGQNWIEDHGPRFEPVRPLPQFA